MEPINRYSLRLDLLIFFHDPQKGGKKGGRGGKDEHPTLNIERSRSNEGQNELQGSGFRCQGKRELLADGVMEWWGDGGENN